MREWLTVIIGLLILAVLLDGIRRVRHARRNSLRRARHARESHAADALLRSELPNGGARVKPRKSAEQPEIAKERVPQQVSLNLDEHVPTLMEVETEQLKDTSRESSSSLATASPTAAERIEPTFGSDDLDEDHPDVVLGLVPERATEGAPPAAERPAMNTKDEADIEAQEAARQREPEEVLVINVMAAAGERLRGDLLLETVLEQGMRFGDMNIFHHHEQPGGRGALLYSMANMVVPGTFDLNSMRDFSTPGVSLFQTLPSETDSAQAFEKMLSTARAIARHLGAELKDENRSVMTVQTMEHYRGRIREFERKQLSRPSQPKATL